MERTIELGSFTNVSSLYGTYNNNIKLLRKTFNVEIIARDNIKIQGSKEAVEKTGGAISAMQEYIEKRGNISREKVEEIVAQYTEPVASDPEGKVECFPVKPRTKGQRAYMTAVRKHEVVFGIGPAGTGKTYLAVAMAIDALQKRQVRKIVLVRPAVEAGEKLGFLPGDYQAKINPYLRPLYDALYDILEYDRLKKYMQKDIIEIAPLAYMRGRTLESAFIILDEAQNTTSAQMKMFLTRLGFYSRMVVTGDITQVDLPAQYSSGLINAQERLGHVEGIKFFHFTKADIVRHPVVQKIVEAYEEK